MKITATLKNDRQPTGKRYATHKTTANGKRETIARRQARALKQNHTSANRAQYTNAGRAR